MSDIIAWLWTNLVYYLNDTNVHNDISDNATLAHQITLKLQYNIFPFLESYSFIPEKRLDLPSDQ
jgi:hypothetical protein